MKRTKNAQATEHNTELCPNCGYCPHCKRGPAHFGPAYVPYYPYWVTPYVYPTTSPNTWGTITITYADPPGATTTLKVGGNVGTTNWINASGFFTGGLLNA